MKQQDKKQYAGVWLDNQHAMIISTGENEDTQEYAISATLKAVSNQGGGSEHSMNNAKQTHQLKYFKELALLLHSFDEILVFGPGQSQEKLQNHLAEDAQFSHTKITIDTADQLTDAQRIAKVREFFKAHQS